VLDRTFGSLWPHLKRGNREPGIIFQKEIACGKNQTKHKKSLNNFFMFLVEMRNACQVTNQSSHGELSSHHNPHLRLCWGLCLLTLALFGEGAQDWNMQLTYILSLLWVMRVKAKTWGVIGKKQTMDIKCVSRLSLYLLLQYKTISQLQTVLITASGPQA